MAVDDPRPEPFQYRNPQYATDDELREWMGSRRETLRQRASRLLLRRGSEAVPFLLGVIEDELPRYRQQIARQEKFVRWHRGFIILSGILLLVLFAPLHNAPLMEMPQWLTLAVVPTCYIGYMVPALLCWPENRLQTAVSMLSRVEDLRCIGALLECRAIAPEPARKALTRLLPRLKASDAGLLTSVQHEKLYALASSWRLSEDRRLPQGALKAIAQIGTPEAVPYVEKLLRRGDKQIKAAAEECLDYLRQRFPEHENSSRLLRPVAAGEDQRAVLLRPVRSGSTEAEQLLRSSD